MSGDQLSARTARQVRSSRRAVPDLWWQRLGLTLCGASVVLVALLAFWALSALATSSRCTKTGSARGERLQGGLVADRLCGLGGNDFLLGEAGDDRLLGGSANDRLRGGTGNDLLVGGSGNDHLGNVEDFAAERGDDRLQGGAGNDMLDAGQGDDVVDGGDGDDVLRMDYGDDRIAHGGRGDDRVEGANGNDGTRTSGGGLFGGPGTDLVLGGGGDDRLFGDGPPDGPEGDDVLFGGGGGDAIQGADGNDLLLGGKGGDMIDGGAGNDVLAGNSAADTLIGGPGDDLVWATDFERNSAGVLDPEFFTAPGDNVIDCGDGNDMAVIDLADDRSILVGCENKVILRSPGSYCSPVSRWLHGGPRKSNLLDLGNYPPNANRVLQTASPFAEKPAWPTDEDAMRSCAEYAGRYLSDPTDDRRPNVRGTPGADRLVGIPAGQAADPATLTPAGSPDGATIFNAGEGDDDVTGSDGRDTVLGGIGDDRIRGGAADDGSLEGEAGDDSIWGGPGDDLVFGRTGIDKLFGEDGADYLEGGRGADVLSGGAGADRLFGSYGRDRLEGGRGNDEIFSFDASADRVDCGPGDDSAQVDRRDRVISCEHVIGPPLTRRR